MVMWTARWPNLRFGDGLQLRVSWLMMVCDILFCNCGVSRPVAMWNAPPLQDRIRFDAAGATHDGFEGVVKSFLARSNDVASHAEAACYA